MPKLSVIIPCFNKAEYLIQMIECIKTQTFTDWELLLVDDGSDFKNYNKISKSAKTDGRIQYIKRNRLPKNGNTCRNIGIELSRGEYLVIFDADDIITPTCFQTRVNFMEKNKNCDYATFPYSTFKDGTKTLSPPKIKRTNDILSSMLSTNYPFTVWANIYRSESLSMIRWDEKVYVYQDFDFIVQCSIAHLKHKWAEQEESDYYYREFSNGNSVCGSYISIEKHNSTIYLFSKIFFELEKLPNGIYYKNKFLQFVILHFERLLLSCEKSQIIEYIEKVMIHYDQYIDTSNNIVNCICKINNQRYKKIFIDYQLYKIFKYSIYRVQLIHDVFKFLIGKK